MKKELRHKLFDEYDASAEVAYIDNRRRKAKKIKAVLEDCGKTSGSLLDVGCSLGIFSDFFSRDFEVTGIDIDENALEYAKKKWPKPSFILRSGEETGFDDNAFDVVICAGVYEHVQNPQRLLNEIRRILKPKGVCYFTAMNRLIPIEPHYRLPFLSYLPQPISNIYLYLFKRELYTIKAFSLKGLRRLVGGFSSIDYTVKIIQDPERFSASEMIVSNSLKQKMALFVAKNLYFMVPTYVWLLYKE